ncbi:MAG TPA: Gfo/Idh/MocA family oxidoreductase [Planctomycetota bacterium]|nr:Gfo/Idh/MocA family oxidoreductase [Planctomycetota bacterium]HRR80459.1 Gfo/Idh/MocA family oxidoreductase [Planctomycetota bacterium]HRT97073.1 Gfo/Idh/MocA family oxidoreductase [Planctomycetota bacterium]
MKRREFLEAGAAGAGLVLLGAHAAESGKAPSDALHVALVGAGDQGRVLINSTLPIPGVRFQAICDAWPYRRQGTKYYLSVYKHKANDYADYREMLDKEKGLDAVLVATPDDVHAEQAVACLKAGLHVYCECPMANTVESARAMARAARETGRLLQIGYQRRSNPRYIHALDKLLREAKLPGRLTHLNAQWCQPVADDLGWPKAAAMGDAELKPFGYASMHELRNWRHFRKHSAGLFAGLLGHALDVANWFLGAPPKSILAAGGTDFYKGREWPDNVMAVMDYETPDGVIRAAYQVLTTTTAGGVAAFEQFMGTEGSLRISEFPRWTKLFHEAHAPDWDKWARLNYVVKEPLPAPEKKEIEEGKPEDPNVVKSRETGLVLSYDLPVVLDKLPHQPHLENFLDAVRGKAKLTCPAEAAFPATVAALKVNEAIEAKRLVVLSPADYAT